MLWISNYLTHMHWADTYYYYDTRCR